MSQHIITRRLGKEELKAELMDVFKERMEAAFQSSCLGNEPLVNGDIKEGINLNFGCHLPISKMSHCYEK